MSKPILLQSTIRPQFFTTAGVPANGYQLFTYIAGTSTKKSTFTDDTLGTPNPNPIILDSGGFLDNSGTPIDVYLDGSYKFVLAPDTDTDPPAAAIWTVDNVVHFGQVWSTLAKATDYTVTTSDADTVVLVDASGAGRTITLLAAATAGDGFEITIKKIDSSTNTVTIDGNASETIDGVTTRLIYNQYDSIKIRCDGSNWHVIATELNDIHGATGSVLEIDKSTTITSGNLVLTSGDLTLTSGDLTLTSGNLSLVDSSLTIADEDARTTTIATPLTVTAETTGTAAAGIGTGILVRAESADEAPSDFGQIQFSATDVSAGSEDTQFEIMTRTAGAALDTAFTWGKTGVGQYNITGAPTVARTITLPDQDLDLTDDMIVQKVQTVVTAVATGTTVLPGDDTTPQNTEGDEYMTLAITPTNSSNLLIIDIIMNLSHSATGQYMLAALFQDTTADALAAGFVGAAFSTDVLWNSSLSHVMTAGTTSATTFKLRAGKSNAGTTTFNGVAAGRYFEGVCASSIIITEYTA